MTGLTSVTALLTPYQAFQVQKWHNQNIDEHLVSKITDLKIRDTCFKKFPDWTTPTPEEIKKIFSATGMTQKQASEYLGLKDNNGRAFRRYMSGESTIPYAYWVLLCAYVGIEKFW